MNPIASLSAALPLNQTAPMLPISLQPELTQEVVMKLTRNALPAAVN